MIGWLAAAIGDGWLTPAARQVLSEGLDLAAEFVASSAKRPGLDVLAAVAPSSSTSPCHRLTHVLGHLPRPARHAVRCFVLGPTERSGVGGPANSLVVWAASEADPASVPARLVAVWRYHAAMLDPQIAEVATGDRERDRLRGYAAAPRPGSSAPRLGTAAARRCGPGFDLAPASSRRSECRRLKVTLCPEISWRSPFSTTGSSNQAWLQCREGLPVPQRSLMVAGLLMSLPYPSQRR